MTEHAAKPAPEGVAKAGPEPAVEAETKTWPRAGAGAEDHPEAEAATKAPEAKPTPTPAPPPRRGESQRDIERGIIRWMFVFFFATHLIGGGIWLAIYLSGHGGG
ncbi:hypothetical protein ACU686_43525 [Yinghuangia aomiensis]